MPSFLRSATAVLALSCAAVLPAAAQTTASTRGAPASIGGLWCGAGLLHRYILEISQQYQNVTARLIRGDRVHELTGHMEGPVLRADPQRNHTMDLLADGNELRIIDASGILALTKGQFFRRAASGSCSN